MEKVMMTRKTKKATAKKTARSPRAAKKTARAATKFDQYLIPGAAVLGGGILTATGVMLRKELENFVSEAFDVVVHRGLTAMKTFDSGKLMSRLGLKKRRSLLSLAPRP